MAPEHYKKQKETKKKIKTVKIDRKELYDKTKELLKEKVRQIDMGTTDNGTTLGSDVYVIFPIDED